MDSIINFFTAAVKLAFVVAVSLVFLTAITTFLGLISSIVYSSPIGEFLGIVSMCLPFDAFAFFASIGVSISAITTFLVASKVYNLLHLSFVTRLNV